MLKPRILKLAAIYSVILFIGHIGVQVFLSLIDKIPFGFDIYGILELVFKLLFLAYNIGFITVVTCSEMHAYKEAKLGWIFLNLMLIPAFYYVFNIYEEERNGPSFKDLTR